MIQINQPSLTRNEFQVLCQRIKGSEVEKKKGKYVRQITNINMKKKG